MCFGGGGASKEPTQVVQRESTASLPPYLEEFVKKNLSQAEGLRGRPYEAYTGDRVAGYGPDANAGFDVTRATAGNWQPNLAGATDAANAAAGVTVQPWTEADMQAYMNPYIQEVMQNALAESERQSGIERNQINARMNQAGAYGGDRHAIVESEQRRNSQDLKQNLISQMMAGAYGDAQSMWQQDQANKLAGGQLNLGAASTLGNLGALGQQLGFGDAAALLDIGERQRGIAQQELDTMYQEYLREFNYPIEMLNLMTGTGAQTPYTTSTMTEENVYGQKGSDWAQGIGAFASLLGGAGSLASAFKGPAAAASSKAFKEDDAPADTILDGVRKMPVRAWRYKPEMGLGTERHVGPYAEDFHEIFGLGDGRTIPYVDAVGVNFAATKELADKVDNLTAFLAAVTPQPEARI